MRPCLVANFANRVGGGEIGLELLAGGLAQRGLVPRLLVPGRGPVGERFERRIIPPSITGGALAIRNVSQDGDLIHTFGPRGLLAAVLARTGKPVILHALTDQPHHLDPLLAEVSDLLVCNSRATARRFPMARRVEVVYNGVPAPVAPSRRLALPDGVKHIGVIGRPVWWKGHLDLLPAAVAIASERDDVDIVFAGRPGGHVSDAVEKTAAEYERVLVLGWVPRIRDHLHEFDLIVVPSRLEGFGRVAVEALRAGVPVLARRAGALPEVLEGPTDPWLPEDPAQWKDKILDSLDQYPDPPDLLRELGARFDLDSQVERIVSLYCELAERAPNDPS